LITSAIGVAGALAAQTMSRLVAWLTVASVGTVLAGVGMFTAAGWSAAMYYMVNSTLVIAGLFLLSELVAAQRGEAADRLQPASAVAQPALLGTMMLLAAASAAGLPPLPGFIGKLLVLEASAVHPWQVAIWSVVLVAGLLTLVGLARAGSLLFWHVRDDISTSGASGASPRLLGATLSLLAMTVAMSIWAAPIQRYTAAAAVQLSDRAAYARAVLGERAETTRPYRFDAPLPKPEATK
jgi:multicomponent K+:H+ antiporter subunit D